MENNRIRVGYVPEINLERINLIIKTKNILEENNLKNRRM
jgi:hypothetical protein